VVDVAFTPRELESAEVTVVVDVLRATRKNVPIPGFDRGNSPLGFENPGKETVVLSTTNGSRAIVTAAGRSRDVVLAGLVNLEAVLREIPKDDVTVVCSGTDGGMAFEDVYLAGLIVDRLEGERTDAALIAARFADGFADHEEALNTGANASVLHDTDQVADIEYSARESILDVVPRVEETRPGIAVVTAGEGRSSTS
jgi:phosphosulfolactate phosphohydrolase-like enzyme